MYFIVTPSLEGWPTKAKKGPSPHETGPTGHQMSCVTYLSDLFLPLFILLILYNAIK